MNLSLSFLAIKSRWYKIKDWLVQKPTDFSQSDHTNFDMPLKHFKHTAKKIRQTTEQLLIQDISANSTADPTHVAKTIIEINHSAEELRTTFNHQQRVDNAPGTFNAWYKLERTSDGSLRLITVTKHHS